MSKIKNPFQKKKVSLERDRRNVYGENDKATRKNLPRKKARIERAHRHAVHQTLGEAKGHVLDDLALEVDAEVTALHPKPFKKLPDVPLGEFLTAQKKERTRRENSRGLRRGTRRPKAT